MHIHSEILQNNVVPKYNNCQYNLSPHFTAFCTCENVLLQLLFSNKTANINDKNWQVYNNKNSHSSKTSNITLVGLHTEK